MVVLVCTCLCCADRPFGFNEFEGSSGGCAVMFASLFDVDTNVVVGSAPTAPGKYSIVNFGTCLV